MDALLRKNNELTAILEVSRVLTSSFELEHNLMAAMQILANHLDMQRGCVFLLDPVSKNLRIVAAHGLTTQEIKRGRYRIGEGIVGRVMAGAAPMFIPNIGDEPKFLNKTDSRPQKSGISFICVPISLDSKSFGAISVDRIYSEERGSVDDDLRVLHIVASLISQFVRLWDHHRQTLQECGELRSRLEQKYSLPNIIGESTPFQLVIKSVLKVAPTDTTVLLLGESGTGKELIAQTLHYQSRRAKKSFVAINLAALPENLIEAELFGVEKGAYTGATERRIGRFEMADGGTLFLDEIGELPLNLQVKLLRVLQERNFERIGSAASISVDVRVVAATNRNLHDEVAAGRFREDLYWRLNVVPIVLPPLRDRAVDIPLLLDHYLNKYNAAYQRRVTLDKTAVATLTGYGWPGNVRELANTVERLVIMTEREVIGGFDLPKNIVAGPVTERPGIGGDNKLPEEVQALERERIIRALQDNARVQQRASVALGITPRQLGYRIKKYNIDLRCI